MTRSELVKFRVTPKTKNALVRVANGSDTTVSELLRDLAHQATVGRSPDRDVRYDMATIRQLANVILSRASADPMLLDAGQRLRDVAARHLGPAA